MIISKPIIHQQLRQLMWHLLACFGLIMVLPVEEAIMNLRDGDGFHSEMLPIFCMSFAPLLTGLIGCANVQADLNEKRYTFWRSKPANPKAFIALKFFIGLVIILIMSASPLLFSIITCTLCNVRNHLNILESMSFAIIGIMTYSLCFACNVIIRRSARAWVVGMMLTCLVLVIPFVLPLGYKDFMSDALLHMSIIYMVLIFAVSTGAFLFSMFAAARDWHLKINLKRILWSAMAMIFAVMMLFSSQIANIKVLQEKQLNSQYDWPQDFGNIDRKIVLGEHSYVNIDKDNISLENIIAFPDALRHHNKSRRYKDLGEDYYASSYPRNGGLYKTVGDDLYLFEIHAIYRKKRRDVTYEKAYDVTYEKLYLRSFKLVKDYWQPSYILDLSDCLRTNHHPQIAMRLIENKLIVFVRDFSGKDNFIVVDVSDPEHLKVIGKNNDITSRYTSIFNDIQMKNEQTVTIPLVPIDAIKIEEQIKFSIDLYCSRDLNYRHRGNNLYRNSLVDINNNTISFVAHAWYGGISRLEVTHWDEKNIYCELTARRPFTIIEQMTGAAYLERFFVVNGKLYLYGNRDFGNYFDNNLMVFDIRSKNRIRKLGHFIRPRFYIEDIAVLENGNILVSGATPKQTDKGRRYDYSYFLYLLKDPK